ncbi:MAG: ribonuclease HII [Chloroflexi bacterium]|mgnify:FL=1|nr:ribonuclease HII [Chloroflexota bacterium]|tara:strand:- start:180 stop:812 length:633 start_codon:yes stop_codon:yes gene_type:complete
MSNLELEKKLWGKSFDYICGLDEVGRGCIAGPVYSGAVILKENFEDPDDLFRKINDSKKIAPKKRETLSEYIQKISHTSSVGSASSEEIDNIGIVKAVKLSMIRAISNLRIKPDFLLIDSISIEETEIPQQNIIKGDQISKSISAASIVAKVSRDKYMVENISKEYPNYSFDKHKGYGTKEHMALIDKYGITKYHRKTFEPIKSNYELKN